MCYVYGKGQGNSPKKSLATERLQTVTARWSFRVEFGRRTRAWAKIRVRIRVRVRFSILLGARARVRARAGFKLRAGSRAGCRLQDRAIALFTVRVRGRVRGRIRGRIRASVRVRVRVRVSVPPGLMIVLWLW